MVPRLDVLPAQSETPDASAVMLVDKRKQARDDEAPSVWLPDLTGSRSVATNLQSYPQC